VRTSIFHGSSGLSRPKSELGLALTDQELFREIRVIRHFCCSRGLKFLL